jgi:hypothetical protein
MRVRLSVDEEEPIADVEAEVDGVKAGEKLGKAEAVVADSGSGSGRRIIFPRSRLDVNGFRSAAAFYQLI